MRSIQRVQLIKSQVIVDVLISHSRPYQHILAYSKSNETDIVHEPAASLNYTTETEGQIYRKENALIS